MSLEARLTKFSRVFTSLSDAISLNAPCRVSHEKFIILLQTNLGKPAKRDRQTFEQEALVQTALSKWRKGRGVCQTSQTPKQVARHLASMQNCRRSGRVPAAHRPALLPQHTPARAAAHKCQPAQPLILLESAGVDRSRGGRPVSKHGHSPGVRRLFSPVLAAASLQRRESPFPANLVRQVTHRQPRRRQPGPASVWM